MLIKRGDAKFVSVIEAPEVLDEEADKLTKAAIKKLENKAESTKDTKKSEN